MKNTNTPIRTGFTAFDRKTKGLRKGDLICIGSRPRMGKTALALNMAANMVLGKKPSRVLVFSLEIDRFSLMQRLLATEAKVELKEVRSGLFKKSKWLNLTKAAARFAAAPLSVNDDPGQSVRGLCSLARLAANEADGVDAIIIDHLQLLRAPKSRNRRHELKEIAQALKSLAVELKVPVIVLSQVAKRLSGDKTAKPQLMDLADSLSVAAAADIVAFVYRAGFYRPTDASLVGKAELILAKNVHGETGAIPLRFRREFGLFESARN